LGSLSQQLQRSNFDANNWKVMYRCISAYPFIIVLSLLLPCIIILFLHLLSTNHMCTQPCYFPLVTRTCCSEGEDGLELFNEEF
jgi:hypothetical protein